MSISVAEINQFDRPAFVQIVGPVFEHSPWIAERAWAQRPFTDRQALHQALCETMYAASEEEHMALIRAHPDLVGRIARAGTLTPESSREQASAGLDALSQKEIALFDEYNREYRMRFGFPFVICARENKKESILTAFPDRLTHTRDEEIATALREIAKIAWFRLQDLVHEPE